MARAQGARSHLAAAFETVYGQAPVSGYTKLPFASITLGSEQPLLASELLGYGRDPLAPIKDAVTTDGDIVVPIDAEAWGFWLKATFGDPTTSETDPGSGIFEHVFESGSWSLPSMSIEKGLPEVPRYEMFTGCMVDTLAWQMTRSGLLTATVSIVAQGETPDTTSKAGSPDSITLVRFGHFNGSISRDGVTLGNVVSTDISYTNNLDRIETIRADGKIDGADPSIAALSGSTIMRFADTTLLDQALAGEACELTFAYEFGQYKFELVAHAVYLPRPRVEIPGPQGVQVTFDWQAALDPVAGKMCTATLVNEVDDY